jgi:hypothetical protein
MGVSSDFMGGQSGALIVLLVCVVYLLILSLSSVKN